MTEDENGRVRLTEEKELMRMWIEDFFMKLLVFKERIEKKEAELKKSKKSTK